MVDVLNQQQRSYCMSRIRGKGNLKTELELIRIFKEHGLTGWRRNQRLFGRPDFIFPKARLAVFVDGCFWHGCSLHSNVPTTNQAFWVRKIDGNKLRDLVVSKTLKQQGWSVIRIWEHDLRKRPKACATRIQRLLAKR